MQEKAPKILPNALAESHPLIHYLRREGFKVGQPSLSLNAVKADLVTTLSSVVHPHNTQITGEELIRQLGEAVQNYKAIYAPKNLFYNVQPHSKSRHALLTISLEEEME